MFSGIRHHPQAWAAPGEEEPGAMKDGDITIKEPKENKWAQDPCRKN